MTSKMLDQHIVQTPGVRGGKPRIEGHRITVQNVAIWHERLGWSADEIANEYSLNMADIYAALAYHFSHREAIDWFIEVSQAFVEELRRQRPLIHEQKLPRAA